jgi:hypothetical protein
MIKDIIGPCPDNYCGINQKCKKGQILRSGYEYNKKSTKKIIKVKPTCIEDKGKPGKGPKLIIIPKEDIGLLEKYGYKLNNNYEERIKSLKKANKELSKLKVLRYINALRTLQKSNEKYYNKLDRDMKWLQNNYTN